MTPPEVPDDVREQAAQSVIAATVVRTVWPPDAREAECRATVDFVIAALSPWMAEQIAAAEQRGREQERAERTAEQIERLRPKKGQMTVVKDDGSITAWNLP